MLFEYITFNSYKWIFFLYFVLLILKFLHHFCFIRFYGAKLRRQKLARLRQKFARFQKFARRTSGDELGRLFSSCSLYNKCFGNNDDNSSELLSSIFNSSESEFENGRIHNEWGTLPLSLLFMLAFNKLVDNGWLDVHWKNTKRKEMHKNVVTKRKKSINEFFEWLIYRYQ